MKRHAMVIFSLVFTLIPVLSSAQTFSSSDAVETVGPGKINWTTGEVYSVGIGAPPASAANPAQARAMTERAAYIVALRNLLETVKGVRVDSETVVENFITKSDVIRTRVDGIVKGARIVKTQYMSDGSVEVTVAMMVKGAFMDAIVPETFGRPAGSQIPQRPGLIPQRPSDIKPSQPAPPAKPPVLPAQPEKKAEPARPEPAKPAPPAPEKKAEPVHPSPQPPAQPEKKPEPVKPEPVQQPQGQTTLAFKGGVATGLVIDGRGLGLRPALLPKLVDQQGREIYVGQVVTRTNAVEQGVAGYAKDVDAALNNFRVTDNPAVIKGLNASGAARTDVVLGQADAQTLRQLAAGGDFLQYCRVIIVY